MELKDIMENISIEKVVDICRNFYNCKDLGGFEEWFSNNIEIKPYIPLEQKKEIIDIVAQKISLMDAAVGGSAVYSIERECILFYDVLLRYTNITVEKNENNYKNYDYLHSTYFYDYFMESLTWDYKTLIEMINNACDMANIISVRHMIGQLDFNKTQENIESLKSLLLDDKYAGAIETILAFNDPKLKAYRKQLVATQMKKEQKQSTKK